VVSGSGAGRSPAVREGAAGEDPPNATAGSASSAIVR
jgi:hypothetical protein